MRVASMLLLGAVMCSAEVFFKEEFGSDWQTRWHHSKKKDDLGVFVRTAGEWFGDEEINQGIKTSQDAKFYAISSTFAKHFTNEDKPIVISYSLKHAQGIDCGGGYIKVMPEVEHADFHGDSPYFIMFGPDICGGSKKIHFIIHYKGENLLWKKTPMPETDKLTHVYTAIINPDGTYEVQVDGTKKESGNLVDDWDFLKPKEIDDPEDTKPADWVDDAEMDDPEDKKPDGWDAIPEKIVDPKAEKPEDWDDEDDGTWEAPMISNPEYKGEWSPKRIPNPEYKGIWKAKQIPNPDYVFDDKLHLTRTPLGSVGIDLWQVKSGSIFDNIIVADNVEEVNAFVEATYGATKEKESAAFKVMDEAEKARLEEESMAQGSPASDDQIDEMDEE